MAADDAGFTTELRGYKKDEVDQTVGALRRDLIKANSDRTEALKEVKRLQALAEHLQAELDEVGSPTYAGLGTKLENTLRVAEEQSTRLIAQADIDAEKLRARVPAYNYVQVIGYNEKRTPGRGSAIFLHVSTGRATAGCVSLKQSSLLRILRWEKPGAVISIKRA